MTCATCKHLFESIKEAVVKYQILLIITIGLTIFDMVSDIILALDYASTGEDGWWFALTLTFFLLPIIPLFFLLLITVTLYIAAHCWNQTSCKKPTAWKMCFRNDCLEGIFERNFLTLLLLTQF